MLRPSGPLPLTPASGAMGGGGVGGVGNVELSAKVALLVDSHGQPLLPGQARRLILPQQKLHLHDRCAPGPDSDRDVGRRNFHRGSTVQEAKIDPTRQGRISMRILLSCAVLVTLTCVAVTAEDKSDDTPAAAKTRKLLKTKITE